MGREKVIRNDVAKRAAREFDPLRGIKRPVYLGVFREVSDKRVRGRRVGRSSAGPESAETSLKGQALHIEDGLAAAFNWQAALNGGKARGAVDNHEPVRVVQYDIDACLSQIISPAFQIEFLDQALEQARGPLDAVVERVLLHNEHGIFRCKGREGLASLAQEGIVGAVG